MDRLPPFFAPPAARARPRGEEAAGPHPKKGPATLLDCRPIERGGNLGTLAPPHSPRGRAGSPRGEAFCLGPPALRRTHGAETAAAPLRGTDGPASRNAYPPGHSAPEWPYGRPIRPLPGEGFHAAAPKIRRWLAAGIGAYAFL